MKNTLYLIIAFIALLVASGQTYAQAIYSAQGKYLGYQQTTPSGVTTTYLANGQSTGSSQVDNGQRSFYTPNGAYIGVETAPSYSVPNTYINTPREVPQVRSIGGW